MRNFGVTELIIILVIVMIIFGVGRLTEIGGALGKSIREFRKSSEGDDETVAGSDSDSEPKQQIGQGNP
ncbi:MAG: twin-arginine translocase TatA/TatE family subunit [SAR202 cluster bacterium]|nr:twin-arginine translocase TatA/TatE family subunit [SAR202 cluster bacterium]HAL49155.1 twin-arginine translocase TatA/TatE family subunit [Dehalococcoidia bacterium]MDP6663870.1 twin-arginine translocase TatA/TatE family subunit [SAR202 cluster bacterium]MDP6799645.1 twin-arginine translocase TatA/TatE family subunit [SAR202 cluster bacterium]MQG57634.1 twin-arginine translocase TatA/TatE family subunit [SAR202 cluster bacterium]